MQFMDHEPDMKIIPASREVIQRFAVEYQGKVRRILASNPADAAYKLAHRHITRSKRLTVAGWSVTHEGLGLYQAYVNGSSTGDTIRVQCWGGCNEVQSV